MAGVKITTRDIVDIITDIGKKLKDEFPDKTNERVASFAEDLNYARPNMPDDMRMSVGKLADDLKLFLAQGFKDRIKAEEFFDNTVLKSYAESLAKTPNTGLQRAAGIIVKSMKERAARRVMESL